MYSEVPTILESFPSPPTHIPSKPHSSLSNPPPSRPPSAPLPPVPGPSRISDHDLLLLSSANGRRSSKYSMASSSDSRPRRDSVASSSSWSLRSFASQYTSAPLSSRAMDIDFVISEEAPDAAGPTIEQLTRLAISPMPLSDDDFELAGSPPLMLSHFTLKKSRHGHNDSIASIDIHDLPAADDDDSDVPGTTYVPPFNAFRSRSHSKRLSSSNNDNQKLRVPNQPAVADPTDPSTIYNHRAEQLPNQEQLRSPVSPLSSHSSAVSESRADAAVDVDRAPVNLTAITAPSFSPSLLSFPSPTSPGSQPAPQPPSHETSIPSPQPPPLMTPQQLHRELRASRSKSTNHKRMLLTKSRSSSPVKENIDIPSKAEPVSYPMTSPPPTERRVRKPSLPPSSFKESDRSSSPDISSILSATPRPPRRQSSLASEMGVSSKSARSSFASLGSRSVSSVRNRKHSGVSSTSGSVRPEDLDGDLTLVRGIWEGVRDKGDLSEVECDDDNKGHESDSSLDLHTPLPNLMVRDGLLSPQSKLLSRAEAQSVTPSIAERRPGSTFSTGSTVRSGIFKDERDTHTRKQRHRDGRLLKGGIGLTTGLGWSDSEDEDAPSPLTRRLSAFTLSRHSSASSMRSARSLYSRSSSKYLSKSYNGKMAYQETEGLDGIDEWGQRRTRKDSQGKDVPPTSWQGKSRTRVNSRISTSSAGSASSLSVITTKRLKPILDSTTASNGNIIPDDSTLNTPSTSSTWSIPLPTTPQDELSIPPSLSKKGIANVDKDKALPPLPLAQPASILKKQSSTTSISRPRPLLPRARTVSAYPSSAASTSRIASLTAPLSPSGNSTPVRPLQLPQQIRSASRAGAHSIPSPVDRPPVPVPSVPIPPALQPANPASSSHLPLLSSSRSIPGLASASAKTALSVPRTPSTASISTPTTPLTPTAPQFSTSIGGLPKPKPRTGTGMVYRKSTHASKPLTSIPTARSTAGSRMQPPMSLMTASLASRPTTPQPPSPYQVIGQAL